MVTLIHNNEPMAQPSMLLHLAHSSINEASKVHQGIIIQSIQPVGLALTIDVCCLGIPVAIEDLSNTERPLNMQKYSNIVNWMSNCHHINTFGTAHVDHEIPFQGSSLKGGSCSELHTHVSTFGVMAPCAIRQNEAASLINAQTAWTCQNIIHVVRISRSYL